MEARKKERENGEGGGGATERAEGTPAENLSCVKCPKIYIVGVVN